MAEAEPELDREEFYRHIRVRGLRTFSSMMRIIGYVYKALGAAILMLRLCMRSSFSTVLSLLVSESGPGAGAESPYLFERLIMTLILRGGDADTNACVAGSLLGTFLGYNSLPQHWSDGMTNSTWLVGKCDALCEVIRIVDRDSGYKGSDDPDTRVDGGKDALTKKELEEREKAFLVVYMTRGQKKVRKDDGKGKSWMGRLLRT